MQFQLLDERRYPLNVKSIDDNNDVLVPFYRWEHRATLGHNTREFMVFLDAVLHEVYIEEIIGGHLETVKDDSLHSALYEFSKEYGLVNVMMPIMKDERRRFV